jgi:hypothetical protein
LHAANDYAGIPHLRLTERLQDIHMNDAYGGLSGVQLSQALASFNFLNAFGADATVGPYTDVVSKDFLRGPGAMSGNATQPDGPMSGASTSDSSASVSVWLIVVIALVAFVFMAGLLVIISRNLAERVPKQDPFPEGIHFSFSGGEVDPETGNAFFTQTSQPTHYHPSGGGVAETSFFVSTAGRSQGLQAPPRGRSFLATADPLSPLHNDRELGADFENPVYRMAGRSGSPDAIVGPPRSSSHEGLALAEPLFARVAAGGSGETGLATQFEAYLAS